MTLIKNEGESEALWGSSDPSPFDITEVIADVKNTKPGVERAQLEKELVDVTINVLKKHPLSREELRRRLSGS